MRPFWRRVFKGLRWLGLSAIGLWPFVKRAILWLVENWAGDEAISRLRRWWAALPDAPIAVTAVVGWSSEHPGTTAVIIASCVVVVTFVWALIDSIRAREIDAETPPEPYPSGAAPVSLRQNIVAAHATKPVPLVPPPATGIVVTLSWLQKNSELDISAVSEYAEPLYQFRVWVGGLRLRNTQGVFVQVPDVHSSLGREAVQLSGRSILFCEAPEIFKFIRLDRGILAWQGNTDGGVQQHVVTRNGIWQVSLMYQSKLHPFLQGATLYFEWQAGTTPIPWWPPPLPRSE